MAKRTRLCLFGAAHAERIKSFMDELSSQYGPIGDNELCLQRHHHSRVAIRFPKSQNARYTIRCAQPASSPVQFPMVVYLPFGQYAANGTLFNVSGQSVKMNTIDALTKPI